MRSFSETEFSTLSARIAEQYSLQMTQESDQVSLFLGWSSDTARPTFCLSTIFQILPNFLKNYSISVWLKLKVSGIEIRSIPTDSLQFFSNLQMMRCTELLFQTRAFLSSLNKSQGRSDDSSYSDEELSLSESSRLFFELFLFMAMYYQMPTNEVSLQIDSIYSQKMASKDQQIDPAIYQYDEIYDQIKGNNKQEKDRERSRSRQKKTKRQAPKQSKYINRMKQIVTNRQKDHEAAYEKKIIRENQKLGINEEMVFVTQSFLKKKEQEKEAAKKKKEEEQKNLADAPQKGDYLNFKKKMLDQAERMYKK